MALRDNPFGEVRLPLVLSAAAALLVAIVAAIALILSDRRETFQTEAYGVTRKVGDAVSAPVSGALATPVRWGGTVADNVSAYFFAMSENRRLRAELQVARGWRDRAVQLQDVNERYRILLGLKTDPPLPMVAGRAVTESHGPFANSRLINVGSERGVAIGNPALSENGLLGRIVGVTQGASRVLLLTDVASRTPVLIDRTNARAILTGDGGPSPRLDYLRGRDPVVQNDLVLTSGDGGVLPRGLPVGRAVKGLDGHWRVRLGSDASAIDFVRILLFQDFRQLINAKALDKGPPPPPAANASDPQALPQSSAVVVPVPIAAERLSRIPPPSSPRAVAVHAKTRVGLAPTPAFPVPPLPSPPPAGAAEIPH